jgi:hypothetical protein
MKTWMIAGAFISITAAVIIFQLFLPPIVGLADQGDFVRSIGKFGFGQDPPAPSLKYVYVPSRYISSSFRVREWEQPTSESLFVALAVLLNKIVSKDGSLSIQVVGLIHALAFLLVYGRFLYVTNNFRCHTLLWVGATVILTDVGYVAYWNSLFREPASILFCLLLITETIEMCRTQSVSTAAVTRWVLWAVLFITAKEQNTPLVLLLAISLLRLRSWAVSALPRWRALPGLAAIFAAGALNIITSPPPESKAAAYNVLFLAIIPESKDASADLATFGLSPRVAKYAGTNTWSVNTGFYDPEVTAAIGTTVTPMTTALFFLSRPARLWRHIRTLASTSSAVDLPAGEPPTPPRLSPATSLRPEFCGNFERSAGYPPGAKSQAFSLWSAFHENLLSRALPVTLFLLLVPPVAALYLATREAKTKWQPWVEFAAIVSGSCLLSFFSAAFGDALDNVKHMLLFNLLLDVCLLWATAFTFQLCFGFDERRLTPLRVAIGARD